MITTTRYFFFFRLSYFSDNYKLIPVDPSKKNQLDADPRTIQQIEFSGILITKSQICTILVKTKKQVLEVNKGTRKIL